MTDAYLVIVTWPDGTEGLLFPRPGNVPICTTREQGLADYATAVDHLNEYLLSNPRFAGTRIRLVRFERHEVIKEYPEPAVPITPLGPPVYTCAACGRTKSHIFGQGYVCEYCAGIED